MPSHSGKQHRFMELIAHDPAAAAAHGISQSVGRDFVEADKAAGKHFRRGKHSASVREDVTAAYRKHKHA